MLNILKNAAVLAGEIQKKYFRQGELGVVNKTNHENIVTEVDKKSQTAIQEYILKETCQMGIETEDVGFVGEEKLQKKGKHLFIIDPLDGTSNYATGTEEFAVLISYYLDGIAESGVMYFPMKDTMYFGEKNKGAHVNKQGKIRKFSNLQIPLHDSFILSSMSYQPEIQAGVPQRILALKPLFRAVRMYGCAGSELAYILEGVAGATLLYGCSIWDIAPGMLLLRETGYEVYDYFGNILSLDLLNPEKTYPFLACHPSSKSEIFQRLKK